MIATPDDAIAEVAAAVDPVATTDGRPPLGLARARCAGAPPAPRRRSIRSCRCPTPRSGAARLASGVTFAVAGEPVGPRDGRVPRRPAGRGGRRGPRRLPRHRLHRRQPRRRAAGPGRAGGRLGRARPRVLPAADPGRRRRRGRARAGRRADRPGRAGATGPRSSRHLDALCPRTSAPATRPAWRWPTRLAGGRRPASAHGRRSRGRTRSAAVRRACRRPARRRGGGERRRGRRRVRSRLRPLLDAARAAGRTRRAGADHGRAPRRPPVAHRAGRVPSATSSP